MRPAISVRLSLCVLMMTSAACGGATADTSSTLPPPTSTTTAPASATTTTTEAPFSPSAAVTGPEEAVFTWQTDRCEVDQRPDLPARAFRSADGTISIVLSSPTDFRMVGPDFDSLQPDCSPIRTSAADSDPGHYRFQEWIGALYTEDGRTIHAIIHDEFHGDEASFASSTRDFGDTQGDGGWSYVGRTPSGESGLEFVDGEWHTTGSLCLVAAWGAHPDLDCRAIRRWTVPESGEFTVAIHASDLGVGGGNGVVVGADQNGTLLWNAIIGEGDTVGVDTVLQVTAEAGDRLDFWVEAKGDSSFDATGYTIEIDRGPRPCTVGVRDSCMMMALTYSRSDDGGATFVSPDPPDHLVAAVPRRYVPDGGTVGIWQPSNIVRNPGDGAYYMLAQIDIHQGSSNVTGECLLRTDDLTDPSSWRAWDGSGFGYRFVDPYATGLVDAEMCPSVLAAPEWSLVYSTFLDRFVAVSEIPGLSPAGVYFRTSEDLVHWSSPRLLMPSTIGFANGFTTPFEAYPSLIDPASPSMSFDTIGQTSYLYFTRVNSYDPLDFDLVRVPVTFSR